MEVTDVYLVPLSGKYYTTEVIVETDNGSVFIEISSGNYKPSQREIDKGWEPDDGMDHVESEYSYEIAKKIVKALKE